MCRKFTGKLCIVKSQIDQFSCAATTSGPSVVTSVAAAGEEHTSVKYGVRWIVGSSLVFGLLVVAGCGDSLDMAEVEGTVTLKGQPLEKIHVEFIPTTIGKRSIGMTDAAGKFTLKTDDGLLEGASVGNHKVVLKDLSIFGDEFLGREAENVDLAKGKKPRISAVYSDMTKTTISQEVVSGKKNEFKIDLDK